MQDLKLHPAMRLLIEGAKANPLIWEMTPQAARALHDPLFKTILPPPEPVARVDDLAAPGLAGPVPVRVYHPKGHGPFPVAVFLHGGGFVLGGIEPYDGICRGLCNKAGCLVVSVGYRLAPEHKFPAALEDACAAVAWSAANAARMDGDPARLALAGDSAGATLAAGVGLRFRDRGGPRIGRQLLVYPVLDLSGFETESYQRFGGSFLLTARLMAWYCEHYLSRPSDGLDPYASPLLATDLEGLPETLILSAEFDVLSSEQEAFAQRLARAGVAVRRQVFPGTVHPFFGLAGMGNAENGMDAACAFLGHG